MGIGLIRVLLAIGVVIAHTSKVFGYQIVDAVVAIQTFYMISGFYMALILNEKYDTFRLFITNRFLRLYPIYLTVFVLTILFSFISLKIYGSWGRLIFYRDYYHVLHPLTLFQLLLTNLSIVGQDIVSFLGLDTNSGLLYFTDNLNSSHPPVFEFLLVPQAWTLGVELSFYMLAPFIVKRNTFFIVFLFGISCMVRFILHQAGLTNDPWNHRFFPAELAFFLTGTLCYKAYRGIPWGKVNKRLSQSLALIIIAFTLSFQFIPIDWEKKKAAYYVLFALLLPMVFSYGRNNRFDRKIGELSYPIYISHIFIIGIFGSMNLFRFIDQFQKSYYALIVILTTLLFSVLLMKYIQEPVERYREIRITKRKRNNESELCVIESVQKSPVP